MNINTHKPQYNSTTMQKKQSFRNFSSVKSEDNINDILENLFLRRSWCNSKQWPNESSNTYDLFMKI